MLSTGPLPIARGAGDRFPTKKPGARPGSLSHQRRKKAVYRPAFEVVCVIVLSTGFTASLAKLLTSWPTLVE